MLISEKDLEEFSVLLKGERFLQMQETDHFGLAYKGRFVRFQKEEKISSHKQGDGAAVQCQ